ncbi:MAG: NAD-dependent epimerase/dehydratase family protein [Halopseudomonas sp.]
MNILITGATGFVGQHLCRALLAQGYAVRVLVRDPGRLPVAMIDQLDVVEILGLDDDRTIAQAVVDIDVVVHLAARVHAMDDTEAQDKEYQRVNCHGTMNLAHIAAEAGVRRLVFLSSIKVNGEERALPYLASDTPNPQDAYSLSKYSAERELLAFAKVSQLDVVIVRPPLIYGPGVKANFSQLIGWVEHQRPLPLAGLNNRRALVSVDNVVDLLRVCISHPNAKGQVFLVSDDESVSTSELIRRIAQAYGVKPRLFFCPVLLLRVAAKLLGKSSGMDRLLGSLSVDINATKQRLDWTPPKTMMQTLDNMANSTDPAACLERRLSDG